MKSNSKLRVTALFICGLHGQPLVGSSACLIHTGCYHCDTASVPSLVLHLSFAFSGVTDSLCATHSLDRILILSYDAHGNTTEKK